MELTEEKVKEGFVYLRPRKSWSFQNISRSETNAYSHSYHRYPAKFIPQIVEKLVTNYTSKGDVVCDVFGGCGTTLVESKRLGRLSVGFDINPISKLITQVKATPIKPKTLKNQMDKFLFTYNLKSAKALAHHPRIYYWFDNNIVGELDRIYLAIKKIKNYKVRNFFFCAFSHNLKNCSRWLMKSIKPTIDKNKIVPNPKESFLHHLNSMIKKNEKYYYELLRTGNIKTSAKMYRKDSTKKLPLRSNSIDLVITSPPYVTSYEYADLHQLSLLWFGDDLGHFKKWNKFSNKYADFRKKFIGSCYKNAKEGDFDSSIAESIVYKLSSIEKPLAIDVANYYLDMKKVFHEIYRILKQQSKACIIIGNTTLRGVEILNAQVAAEQMLNLGFRKVELIKREVPSKMITPWRDSVSGKFTGLNNPLKKRVYQFEYILIMEK